MTEGTNKQAESAPVHAFVMPCPFCGGTVKVEFRPGECGYSSDGLMIRCAPCGIAFHEDAEKWERGRGTVLIREEAEAKLLKRWNTRHQA